MNWIEFFRPRRYLRVIALILILIMGVVVLILSSFRIAFCRGGPCPSSFSPDIFSLVLAVVIILILLFTLYPLVCLISFILEDKIKLKSIFTFVIIFSVVLVLLSFLTSHLLPVKHLDSCGSA